MTADLTITYPASMQAVTHSWKTGIQLTINGAEKRSALKTWPKINVHSTYPITGNNHIIFLKRSLYQYSDGIIGIPLWCDKSKLTAPTAAADLQCDTRYRRFYTGRQIIVVDRLDHTKYEIGRIASISDSQITLTENLTKGFSDGWILPFYECRILSEKTIRLMHQGRNALSVESEEIYETQRAFEYTIPDAGAPTYNGKYLFLARPKNNILHHFDKKGEYTSWHGMGYYYPSYSGYSSDQFFSMKYLRTTYSGIWDCVKFFDAHCGRLTSFYIPVWNRDFVIIQAFQSTDTSLKVNNPNDAKGRDIYIEFPDGTYTCRNILSVSGNDINLDGQIGKGIDTNDISGVFVCFLEKVRFIQDDLKFNYIRPGVAEFAASFKSVRREITT